MMSNSSLVFYRKISPNRSSPRNKEIDTITIHCVVGQTSVETLGSIFAPASRKASSNYGVGFDGKIGMYCEEKDRSWCSSSSANDNRAITIEVASDTFHPHKVNDVAYKSLINLLVDICKRNPKLKDGLRWEGNKSLVGNIARQNMTVHRWFANKSCPGDYLYNLHGQIAKEVNEKLKGDGDVDLKRFKELMKEYRAELQDNDSSAWSKEAREWAISTGLVQGTSSGEFNAAWEDFLTREQMAALLFRFAQMMGKA